LTSCSKRGYYDHTDKKKRVRFSQIFVAISEVSPIICEKSCQKCMTISVPSRSTVLRYCQIFVIITTATTRLFCRIVQRQAQAKPGQESVGCAAWACRASAGFARRPASSFYQQSGRAGPSLSESSAKDFWHLSRVGTGVTAFCRIRSYLSTMQKQGHSMLSALTAVFHGQPLPVAWAPE
jgi:hypothetical protein